MENTSAHTLSIGKSNLKLDEQMAGKEIRKKFDLSLSPIQKEAIERLTTGPVIKLDLANKIGDTWLSGEEVPEFFYKHHSIGNFTVAAIEKGNAEISEKISGKEIQERINVKLTNLSELVSSPEKIELLLKAEKENVFSKPESLNGQNIVEVIKGRIDNLNYTSVGLRGVENKVFKIKKGDLCTTIDSMDFKQQIKQAQRLIQPKSRGLER